MAFSNGKETWDWAGDDGANYHADYLMQGYGVGRRSDVDYARQCKNNFEEHCEKWPHLSAAWRAKWAVMLAKARKWGW